MTHQQRRPAKENELFVFLEVECLVGGGLRWFPCGAAACFERHLELRNGFPRDLGFVHDRIAVQDENVRRNLIHLVFFLCQIAVADRRSQRDLFATDNISGD